MEKRQQLELIDKMIREVNDLKNSQTAVLKKITHIEAENITAGVQILEKELPDLHETMDKNLEKVGQLLTQFEDYRGAFVKKYSSVLQQEENQ